MKICCCCCCCWSLAINSISRLTDRQTDGQTLHTKQTKQPSSSTRISSGLSTSYYMSEMSESQLSRLGLIQARRGVGVIVCRGGSYRSTQQKCVFNNGFVFLTSREGLDEGFLSCFFPVIVYKFIQNDGSVSYKIFE